MTPTVQRIIVAIGVLVVAISAYELGTFHPHASPYQSSCADDSLALVVPRPIPLVPTGQTLPAPPNIQLSSGVEFDASTDFTASLFTTKETYWATLSSWRKGDSVTVCKDVLDNYFTIIDHNKPNYNNSISYLDERVAPSQ